ncbi:MAG: hypothetical protein QM621_12945 [Aeromicrobium sp.]|uniref:hypothetical protein n=1 Tax=Aeromicrobium sp. TaxID=1871063 RepID=UPI0039E4C628
MIPMDAIDTQTWIVLASLATAVLAMMAVLAGATAYMHRMVHQTVTTTVVAAVGEAQRENRERFDKLEATVEKNRAEAREDTQQVRDEVHQVRDQVARLRSDVTRGDADLGRRIDRLYLGGGPEIREA